MGINIIYMDIIILIDNKNPYQQSLQFWLKG